MAQKRPYIFSSNRLTGRPPISNGAELTQDFRHRMTERVNKTLGDIGLADVQPQEAALPVNENNYTNQRTEE